ncbi:hypothetical protein BAZSYMA_ACONTIG00454_0 [Bathymodiolus azoricus thioautotrophic gill symbiont]|uniref:Uncharacterized protein n=1 Tax=Bathymodiolus azoricus thioautotrophic gill symbiont TaxID=235205 RepID=A0A1H6JI31_9GAMM|nr:hypothetical protein BAZSYMA_ACONTIG00454_0 [Bathymodiolus azoricus thioautotrophic gill symbiont]
MHTKLPNIKVTSSSKAAMTLLSSKPLMPYSTNTLTAVSLSNLIKTAILLL